jgi:vesicular inhibitory amino acid transporter
MNEEISNNNNNNNDDDNALPQPLIPIDETTPLNTVPFKRFTSLEIGSKEINFTNINDFYGKVRQIYFQPMHPGSLRASIFCLICVTLGSGMLPLPYFFKTNGIILTLLIYFFCAFSTLRTLKILCNLSYKTKIYSYNELVAHYFGQNSKMVIYSITVLLINSLGSIIAWSVLISKFLKDIYEYINIPQYKIDLFVFYTSLIILCFIQIPLATFKTVAEFYIVSTIGIIQILYVIIVLIIEFPFYFTKYFHYKLFFNNTSNFFNVNLKLVEMPLCFFIAFGNHSTILSVIYEIQNKTKNRVQNAGRLTFYSELVIYLIIMFISFFSTFDYTNEIYLDRPHVSKLMIIGELFMMILMICNISLYYYMMIPLLQLFFNDNKPFKLKQSFLMAFTTLTLLTFISFYIKHIITLFSFIGASAQVSLIFVLPINLYMVDNKDTLSVAKRRGLKLTIGFFCFIGLMFFMLLIVDQFINVM